LSIVPPISPKVNLLPNPLPKTGLSSIEKLKQQIALNKKQEADNQEESDAEEILVVKDEETPITTESFGHVWSNYLAHIEAEKKMSLWVIFRNATWEIQNDGTVVIILASQHESEMFEEERINAIPFLRKNLRNTNFDINIKVISSVAYKRAFTADEKFELMAESNPLLNDLRKLLALDLE
jgi:DNA polymerase-3 subunit gamma/tau